MVAIAVAEIPQTEFIHFPRHMRQGANQAHISFAVMTGCSNDTPTKFCAAKL